MTSAADLPVGSIVFLDGRHFTKQPPDRDPWVKNHPWMAFGEGRRTNDYIDDMLAAGAQVLRVGTGQGQ